MKKGLWASATGIAVAVLVAVWAWFFIHNRTRIANYGPSHQVHGSKAVKRHRAANLSQTPAAQFPIHVYWPPGITAPTTVSTASEQMAQLATNTLRLVKRFHGRAGTLQILGMYGQMIQYDYAMLIRLHAGPAMLRAAAGIQYSENLIVGGMSGTSGDVGIGIEGLTVRLPELLAAIKPLDPTFKPQ